MSQHAAEFLKVREVRDRAWTYRDPLGAALYTDILRRMAGELIAPGC